MAEPTYTVKALDQSTRAAFAALVEHNNGIFGGCWRMGFHPADSQTDAAHNRAAKEQRVREGLGGGTVEGYPEDAGCPPGSSSTAPCQPTRSSGSP